MLNKRFACLAVLIALLFVPIQAFAQAVDLDGSFDDWKDKPFLNRNTEITNPVKDIIQLRWYPDPQDSMMYFYCERLQGTDDDKHDKFVDWNLEVFFDSEGAAKKAEIEYHPPSNKVEVRVYDAGGNYLWGEKGKWGDDKDTGKRIEFSIPLNYVAGPIQAGYQFNAYFMSGDSRFPESGSITISTVSTFPLYTVLLVILSTLIIAWVKFRRVKWRMFC